MHFCWYFNLELLTSKTVRSYIFLLVWAPIFVVICYRKADRGRKNHAIMEHVQQVKKRTHKMRKKKGVWDRVGVLKGKNSDTGGWGRWGRRRTTKVHLVQRIVSNTLYVNFKKLKDENTTCLNLRWYFNC